MHRFALSVALLMIFCLTPAAAQPAPAQPAPAAAKVALTIPSGAAAGPNFDVERATQAWIETLSPEKRAKSDAYFEGGYWLLLWDFLYGLAVAWIFLGLRLSARMRDFAAKVARGPTGQSAIYALLYIPVATILAFPLTWYEGFYREHEYGMANQTFWPWFSEQLTGFAVGLVLGGLLLVVLYAVFRRTGARWWQWGAAVTVAFLIFLSAIAPVLIAPLFNDYKALPDGPLRTRILSLAHAAGVPANEVYWFDASRQTKRISANVSGFGATTRISLNDNLLNRTAPESIESVMGHEIGHYALNHVYEGIVYNALLTFIGFAWLAWSFDRAVARWGTRWGVGGIADPAGVPLLVVLYSIYGFVATPIQNSITRSNETEADRFGIALSGQPDGFAAAAMMLSEYRKISPGYWEEIVFYDHPSGSNRVRAAMQWKAEHLPAVTSASPLP